MGSPGPLLEGLLGAGIWKGQKACGSWAHSSRCGESHLCTQGGDGGRLLTPVGLPFSLERVGMQRREACIPVKSCPLFCVEAHEENQTGRSVSQEG